MYIINKNIMNYKYKNGAVQFNVGFHKSQFTLIPTISYQNLFILWIIGIYFLNFSIELMVDI